VARNPLIWAGRGFLLNLAGFVPPAPLQAFLGGWLMPRSPSA
jgi:hypothetical protein